MLRHLKAYAQLFYQSHPLLYYPVRNVVPARQFPVRPSTDLCVEAYPSSANSFLFVTLRNLDDGVRYAHHTHALASLKRAVAYGTPTVFIIRAPADAVSSRHVRFGTPLRPSLLHYIRLYRFVAEHADELFLVEFEDIKNDLRTTLERVVAYAGLDADLDRLDVDAVRREGFEFIDEFYREHSRPERSGSPSAARDRRKAEVVGDLEAHPLFARADELYRTLRRAQIDQRDLRAA